MQAFFGIVKGTNLTNRPHAQLIVRNNSGVSKGKKSSMNLNSLFLKARVM